MKKSKHALLLLLTGFFSSACTNHLYQGYTHYQYAGKTCDAMVYWQNTTHLFAPDGLPTDVNIRMASTPKIYRLQNEQLSQKNDKGDENKRDSFVLLMPVSEYVDAVNNSQGEQNLVCGRLEGIRAHMQGSKNTTEFTLYCDRGGNRKLSITQGSTPQMSARKTAYTFAMQTPVSELSFMKKELEAMKKELEADVKRLDCRVSNKPVSSSTNAKFNAH